MYFRNSGSNKFFHPETVPGMSISVRWRIKTGSGEVSHCCHVKLVEHVHHCFDSRFEQTTVTQTVKVTLSWQWPTIQSTNNTHTNTNHVLEHQILDNSTFEIAYFYVVTWYLMIFSIVHCWAVLLYKSFYLMFHHPSSIHKYNIPWYDIHTLYIYILLYIYLLDHIISYDNVWYLKDVGPADPLSSPVAWLHLLFCALKKVSRGTSTGFGQFPSSTQHQVLKQNGFGEIRCQFFFVDWSIGWLIWLTGQHWGWKIAGASFFGEFTHFFWLCKNPSQEDSSSGISKHHISFLKFRLRMFQTFYATIIKQPI